MIAMIQADARRIPLPDRSVQCVATSPPYWSLRSYEGVAETAWGGDPGCAHEWGEEGRRQKGGTGCSEASGLANGEACRAARNEANDQSTGKSCRKCDAWLGCLGLEPTPERFVAHLVECFREVRRVLRDDGVLWLNMGDTYVTKPPGRIVGESGLGGGTGILAESRAARCGKGGHLNCDVPGLKHKDLVGVPWMLAFALRADGWFLRAECIWSKPNPMRESVRDRPTRSHEHLFLLAKSERYYFDRLAIAESAKYPVPADAPGEALSNKLTVWSQSTRPFKGAHFATWPPDLVEPMIRSGSSDRGCCPACHAPWARVVVKHRTPTRPGSNSKIFRTATHRSDIDPETNRQNTTLNYGNRDAKRHVTTYETVGWEPGCGCKAGEPVPCLVLDPFGGSGTTALVAGHLGRHGLGLEPSPAYLPIAAARIAGGMPRRGPRRRSPTRVPDLAGQIVMAFGER